MGFGSAIVNYLRGESTPKPRDSFATQVIRGADRGALIGGLRTLLATTLLTGGAGTALVAGTMGLKALTGLARGVHERGTAGNALRTVGRMTPGVSYAMPVIDPVVSYASNAISGAYNAASNVTSRLYDLGSSARQSLENTVAAAGANARRNLEEEVRPYLGSSSTGPSSYSSYDLAYQR